MPRYVEESELIAGRVSNDPIVIAVKCAKTADVVERKTGKWYIDTEGDVRCTACKTKCLRDDIGINILSNYCPNCGAKMEKEA